MRSGRHPGGHSTAATARRARERKERSRGEEHAGIIRRSGRHGAAGTGRSRSAKRTPLSRVPRVAAEAIGQERARVRHLLQAQRVEARLQAVPGGLAFPGSLPPCRPVRPACPGRGRSGRRPPRLGVKREVRWLLAHRRAGDEVATRNRGPWTRLEGNGGPYGVTERCPRRRHRAPAAAAGRARADAARPCSGCRCRRSMFSERGACSHDEPGGRDPSRGASGRALRVGQTDRTR